MPTIENFTIYTEVDPNSRITITSASKIDFAGITRQEDAYVYKDKGADHFAGDFEHLEDIKLTANTSSPLIALWMMANDIDDFQGLTTANKSFFSTYIGYSGGILYFFLFEVDGGTLYNTLYQGSLNTPYYLKIKRDEAVGTYGTLYCYIYSDAARTNLLATLSLTLHTSKKDFRYIYAVNTINDESAGTAWTGYIENLDLQEAAPAVGRSQGFIF